MITFENVVRHFNSAGSGSYMLEVSLEDAQVSTHPFQLTSVGGSGTVSVLHMSPDTVRELADAIYRMLEMVDEYESEGE